MTSKETAENCDISGFGTDLLTDRHDKGKSDNGWDRPIGRLDPPLRLTVLSLMKYVDVKGGTVESMTDQQALLAHLCDRSTLVKFSDQLSRVIDCIRLEDCPVYFLRRIPTILLPLSSPNPDLGLSADYFDTVNWVRAVVLMGPTHVGGCMAVKIGTDLDGSKTSGLFVTGSVLFLSIAPSTAFRLAGLLDIIDSDEIQSSEELAPKRVKGPDALKLEVEEFSFILKSNFISSPQITAQNYINEFNKILHTHKVIICSTRVNFIEWCATTFRRLSLSLLEGVGNCGIAVGERGTGKSFLFKKIAAATVVFIPNTIVCYVMYKVINFTTPLEVLIARMKSTYNEDWSGIKSMTELYYHLEKENKYMIFFIDDLDSVYAESSKASSDIILQLLAISEMNRIPRRILVVATGSSISLRRLCFASATNEDRVRFPAYSGRNFSYRKYTCHTISSIQSVKELLEAKRILRGPRKSEEDDEIDGGSSDGDDEVDEEHCMSQLSLTRGVMQSICDIKNEQIYPLQQQIVTFMENRTNPALQKLWRALLKVLRNKSRDNLTEVIGDCHKWTTSLPTATFSDMREEDSSITLDDLYMWEDIGFLALTVDHNTTSSSVCHTVTFSHGTDLMWAITKLSELKTPVSFGQVQDSDLNCEEKACFLNPAGNELHQELIAEALACKYELVIPGIDHHRLQFQYAYDVRNLSSIAECWGGQLYKITPDTGVDLVAVHDVVIQGKPTLILCVFQCKMTQNGKSRLSAKSKSTRSPNVHNISAGFQRTIDKIQSTVLTADKLAGRELVIKRFLVTPLLVSDNVHNILKENLIELIGRVELQQLWPERVQDFIRSGGVRTDKLKFLIAS